MRLTPDDMPLEFSFYYKNWPFKPLREPYPFVLPDRPEENRLYYRAMLLHFRQILDDAAFAELQARPVTPDLLQGLAHSYRQAVAAYYDEQARRIAAKLSGERVYFWGHGVAWRRYADLFAKARPDCFISDLPEDNAREVDGIPVRTPEELLADNAPALPGVMFVREDFVSWAAEASAKYPGLISGNLRVALLGQAPL